MEVTPEKWKQVKALFDAALQQPPSLRRSFLAQICSDEDARDLAEKLLISHEQAGSFLNGPFDQSTPSTPADSVHAFDPGEIIAERFRITKFIARGGVGEVYEAVDLESQATVAIKTIRPDVLEAPKVQERFKREVALAKEVTHSNVCRVFDIFRYQGNSPHCPDILFVSMEFLPGETLADRIKRKGRMSTAEALPLITQMAHALSAAHDAGIVHRDFKPANVILVPQGASGEIRAVVTDFGLAIRPKEDLTLSLTRSSQLIGTPAYMSPEQVEGHDLTPASDIYSLGLVIYEMVTGARPFDGDSPLSVAIKRLKEAPKPPREFVKDLNARWQEVIIQCLQVHAKDRFTHARDVVQALVNPKTRGTRPFFQRKLSSVPLFLRKHPSLIIGFTLLLLCGSAIAAWVFAPDRTPRVVRFQQLIHSTRYIGSRLFTDGLHVFFLDWKSSEIVQVPVEGDRVQRFSLGLHDVELLDMLPDRSTFLLRADCHASHPTFWQFSTKHGVVQQVEGLVPPTREWYNSDPAWSPDRKKLAFIDNQTHALYIAEPDGSSPRAIFSPGKQSVVHPRWSPDGNLLRFTLFGEEANTHAIWEVKSDGSGARPMLSGDWNKTYHAWAAEWTPDKAYYVFIALPPDEKNQGIVVHRERGGWWGHRNSTPTKLTDGSFPFYYPIVSPDGKRIFAVGIQTGYTEVARYDRKAQTFVTFLPDLHGTELVFSRDGKWVAYTKEGILWRARSDGTEEKQLTYGPLNAGAPHWSPDGRQLAFLGKLPGGVPKIYLTSRDGGTSQEAIPSDQNEEGVPTWSPDGRSLVFGEERWFPNQIAIHILDLATGKVSTVPGSRGLWTPRWSPDGQHLLALTPNPHSFDSKALWVYSFGSQTWKKMIDHLVDEPVWSHDGKRIYFNIASNSETTVFRIGIGDGRLEKILDLGAFPYTGTWLGLAPDDSPLLERDTHDARIYALDIVW